MTTKEKILKYIENNYNNLLILTKVFNKYNYSDILSDLYLYFFEKEKIKDIPDDKIFIYLYFTIKNQSRNYKYRLNNVGDVFLIFDNYIDEKENEIQELRIKKYNSIYNILNQLKKEEKIDWYEHKMFLIMYYPEYIINIKGKTKKEVDDLRKSSLRKIEKLTKISHSSVNYTIKKVIKLLKDCTKN